MSKWNKEYLKEYDRKRYQDQREERVRKQREKRKEWREWMFEYKSQRGCSKCPEKHPACLQFHHLSNKEKEVAIMVNQCWGKEKILTEIDKCILICANCHFKEHYEEQ